MDVATDLALSDIQEVIGPELEAASKSTGEEKAEASLPQLSSSDVEKELKILQASAGSSPGTTLPVAPGSGPSSSTGLVFSPPLARLVDENLDEELHLRLAEVILSHDHMLVKVMRCNADRARTQLMAWCRASSK